VLPKPVGQIARAPVAIVVVAWVAVPRFTRAVPAVPKTSLPEAPVSAALFTDVVNKPALPTQYLPVPVQATILPATASATAGAVGMYQPGSRSVQAAAVSVVPSVIIMTPVDAVYAPLIPVPNV